MKSNIRLGIIILAFLFVISRACGASPVGVQAYAATGAIASPTNILNSNIVGSASVTVTALAGGKVGLSTPAGATTESIYSQIATRHFGRGLYFPGNRTLSIPSILTLGTTDFTLFMRVRLPDYTPASPHTFYRSHSSPGTNCVAFNLTSAGTFTVAFTDGGTPTTTTYTITPTTALTDGEAYTIAVTCDRDGLATLYINGTASGTAISIAASSAVDLGDGDDETSVGTIGSNATGIIYDLRLYKSALSAASVIANTKLGFTDPLDQASSWANVWFDLAMGYGDMEIETTVFDRSANGYHATASGVNSRVTPTFKDFILYARQFQVPTNGTVYFSSLSAHGDFDLTNGAWYGTGPVALLTPHETTGDIALSRGMVLDLSPCCGTNVAPGQVDIGSYNFNYGGLGPVKSYQSLRLRADTNHVLVGSSFGGDSSTFTPAAQPMLIQDLGGNVGIGYSISQANITPISDRLKVNGQAWFEGNEIKIGTTPNQIEVGALASPNTFISGSPGDLYLSSGGGANATLWVKETGSATTSGWVPMIAASDTAYNATSWNGVSTIPPTKNAVRDEIELRATKASPALTGTATAANVTISGTTTLSALTANTGLALNSNKEIISGSAVGLDSYIQPVMAYTPRGGLHFGDGSAYLVPAQTPLLFGTNDFSVHMIASLPDWTPSVQLLFFNNRNSTTNNVYLQLQTSGAFNLVVKDSAAATATYVLTPDVALTDGDIYDFVLSVDRDGFAYHYINSLSDRNSDATEVRVDVSASSAVNLGDNAGTPLTYYSWTGGGNAYEFQLFNKALSASESKSLAKTGIPRYENQWGGLNYTSDFTAGADSWSSTSTTVAGNIDSIGGVDNVLRLTAASTINYASRTMTREYPGGMSMKLSYDVYIPSGNTTLVKAAGRRNFHLRNDIRKFDEHHSKRHHVFEECGSGLHRMHDGPGL